ncbi:MAG TPA: cobyrinate a,c-diamide synthase [Thermohalobaculum sp.]|nr:cobyrinate a,c-diamide synthase [Thermohalobaculum sp.]
MRGLVISAPASGSGKTTVTLGLLAAMRRRGLPVVSAKSGPDYIDPAFHEAATGVPCMTLDAWAADPAQLRARAQRHIRGQRGSHLVVEGAMGLFDGAPDEDMPLGRGATADVAAALGLPVMLVIDASHMGHGTAAVAAGLAGFRDDVHVAGVILNRLASARHERILRGAVETVLPVLGALGRRDDLALPSRHLGLVQAGENADLAGFIARAADWVAAGCDIDAILADSAYVHGDAGPPAHIEPLGSRIAVARDRAFGFAYAHLLDDWRALGAELSFFSPLAGEGPDSAADAVFLPGGYPELHAGTLAAAEGFRAGMAAAAARGALIYGECGGYMVLGDGLVDGGGARHRMLGLLRLETSFAERRRHLGYRALTALGGLPWHGVLRGHEFHYATTIRAEGEPLFLAHDAEGEDLGEAGLRSGRVMGSFAHVIEVG